MTPEEFTDDCQALCKICQSFGARGWCRATSGNFSIRVNESCCLITRSGRDKSRLTPDDLMVCNLDGNALDPDCRPSAETPLHMRLYQLDDRIGAVLHTHSVSSTLLSRQSGSHLNVSGFEMQKAFSGVTSHEADVSIPVYDNDQDMDSLADLIEKAWDDKPPSVPGFLIRGHGLYAWGKNAEEAERHVEGFEFLFECMWQEVLARTS